ncbi:MAG: hypothetical protein JNK49_19550 [Planctomycetes bacterium]|nr:hypothetical protein [Planctomycetota bacterium]
MIEAAWLPAFALTLAIEVPLVAAWAPRGQRLVIAGIAAAAQACTHPVAWLAVLDAQLGWWTVEVAVVVVEASFYLAAGDLRWRAPAAALLANAASAWAGLACWSA